MKGKARDLLIIAIVILMVACEPRFDTHSTAWKYYLDGLRRVLNREATTAAFSTVRYPHPASVKLKLINNDINLLEFLSLRSCALAQTLAEQNSILGRHRNSATDLVFSLRFLDEVLPCITYLEAEGNSKLANTLATVRAQKQQQLARRLVNALLAGNEYRLLWSSPPDQRQTYPSANNDIAIAALERWQHLQQRWLAGDNYGAHTEVIPILAALRAGLGGEMLHFQAQTLAGLTSANALLKQRLDGRPLCLQAAPTPRAKHYQAVLHKQFISNLQPLAAQSHRHQHALMNVIKAIERTLTMHLDKNELPTAYTTWQEQRDTLINTTTTAHRQHVSLSQQLLQQCGLSTGN